MGRTSDWLEGGDSEVAVRRRPSMIDSIRMDVLARRLSRPSGLRSGP